ncbi:hypothetical protein LTR86_004374 [Recurvomyces mirabilis]|nr:hypothetical protein LTR86_004374 [Recurvomyces mirabilis]
MAELSTTGAGLATSGIGRLRAMQDVLWRTSVAMGTESPEIVASNFLTAVKETGPRLNTLITLVVPWAMLAAACWRYDFLCRGYDAAKNYLASCVYASIVVPSDHQLHQQVLQWMLENVPQNHVRSLAVVPRIDPPQFAVDQMGRQFKIKNKRSKVKIPIEDSEDSELSMSYLPAIGTYAFNFRGYRMTVERTQAESKLGRHMMVDPMLPSPSRREESILISVRSLWNGVQPIKDFLEHIEAETAAARENKTTIFRPWPDARGWDVGVSRVARNLDAVTLQKGLKEALVQDVEAYLHPKTRRYYNNRGIPWRRGYLFFGPPGTGKTSLATALAGHFDLNVYMASLSSMSLNDSKLDNLFSMLPQKCMVLLEDIDSAGVRREKMAAPSKRPPMMPMMDPFGNMQTGEQDGITLSGLLNVIDGVRAAEGRILIMTTNHPETLDEALIRRGRIDQKIHFDCASKETAVKLFTQVFCKTADELLDGEVPQDEATVAKLAQEFVSTFEEDSFTPAEVQGYLIDHRTNPEQAVQQASTYFEQLLNSKIKGLNVLEAAESSSESDSDSADELSPEALADRILNAGVGDQIVDGVAKSGLLTPDSADHDRTKALEIAA